MDQSKNDLKQQALNYLRTICKPYAPIGIAITGPDQRHQLDDGSSYTTFWNENQSTLHLIYYSSIGSTKYKTFALPPQKKALPLHRQYWQAGFTIIPLKGKRPIHQNWPTTPYQTESDLLQLESEGLGNFGVLCQSWLIIDIDARNGGVESYQKLLQQLPELQHSGFIVKTGSGGGSQHIYYRLPLNTPKLQSKHHDYPGIDFKTTGQVVGAGSIHPETKQPYEIEHGSPSTITEAPSRLIELLKREKPSGGPKPMPKIVSTGDRTTQIIAMLEQINPDVGYEDWIRIGMGIHHETYGSETGYEIWYAWSSHGTKFKAKEMRSKWKSFSGGGVTFGTLISLAKAHGYVPTTLSCNNFQPVENKLRNQPPRDEGLEPTWAAHESLEERDLMPRVEEECETTFDYVSEINRSLKDNPLLKGLNQINLKQPPGFVGELTQWINDQCLYPREELAVAASLYTISVLGGLKYVDDLSSVTPNMLFFGVAGSASGKDAIYSAVAKILSQTGYGETISGDIKSEQDIHKSFLEHQMVNYYVDEIGEFLGKVKSASRTGSSSAHYMHGILAGMMKIFTKANERLFLNKDVVRAWKKEATAKIKELKKSLEESKDNETSYEAIQAQDLINTLENRMNSYAKEGIQKPFLSLMSFTTPETFESHVNQENVEKGLIGRAVIINEKDTNPFDKDNFQKRPMGVHMNNTLFHLGNIEKYLSPDGRIENLNERELIKSTPEALNKLKVIRRFIIRELAELHKKNTGLEAIVRRSAEMVQKVSLILSIPTGQRTVDDVDWAFAFVWRDLMTKIKMITATEDGESGIEARVYTFLEKKGNNTACATSIIANKLRLKNEQAQNILNKLVRKGRLASEEVVNPRNGKTTVKYKLP